MNHRLQSLDFIMFTGARFPDSCNGTSNPVQQLTVNILADLGSNEVNHKKIAIDRSGNVVVVGYDTNTMAIPRLHSDGTVDCVVLKESDGVNGPLSICFNKSCHKLYMANLESCVVHVYSCS